MSELPKYTVCQKLSTSIQITLDSMIKNFKMILVIQVKHIHIMDLVLILRTRLFSIEQEVIIVYKKTLGQSNQGISEAVCIDGRY